ncbi:MAG: Gfo/Idh/MocA family oxidoreductase [Proteobacteria bacterium]|nr:Gfo/Idh/MocA family oxidoreductase [Pseudomonadota bacterium]
MNADGQLGVGMVGCGRITDLGCLGYLDHPRSRVVATCDADPSLAERRAAEWGAERWYTSLQALLDDPAVDAVDIATPHHLHADHAVAAIEADRHVSLQKPPARTLDEFDRIAHAAGESERVLRVFDNFLYYPPHQRARQLIEEGTIGEPLSIRIKTAAGRPGDGWEVPWASQSWRLDVAASGGGAVTFDHGYHCYSLARYLVGAEVDRVHAFINWQRFEGGLAADGPAMLSWRYQGDPVRYGCWEVVASLGMKVKSDYYSEDDRVEVTGEKGVLWINRCTGRLLEEPALVVYADGETRAFHDLDCDWASSFRLGGRAFVDACLYGGPVVQDPASARHSLAFALAAAESAESGREITPS